MANFINLSSFSKLSRFKNYIGTVSCLFLAIGFYLAIFQSPEDYQQGQTVRIMYIHVPAAWMSLFIYSAMTCFAASGLIWRNPLSYIMAKECAVPGACFTLITLVSGSLWGKPMWGTWWVWDARLTSVLILFFIYLGIIFLYDSFDNYTRGEKSAAMLTIIGFINIPIIKFSVDWWNTLHQPASVIRMDGPAIDPSMLWPLLLIAAGFTFFFFYLLIIRTETEITLRKLSRNAP